MKNSPAARRARSGGPAWGRAAPIALLAAASIAGSCAPSPSETPPTRACGLGVWHKPASASAHVEIVGAWDGWRRPGVVPERRSDGWRVAAVDVPPGEHAYAIVEDGVWLTDKSEPMTGLHEGREVTIANAPDCERPELRVSGVETTAAGDARVHVTFLSAKGARPIDARSIRATDRAGEVLTVASVDPERGAVTLEASGLARGKYTYTIEAEDTAGTPAERARATVWIDAASTTGEPWDPRDAIVYQIFLDRFLGPDGALAPPASPSARAGGTIAGVRRALERGDIEALGANTLWLSPLYANPHGEFPGNDGRSYTSYHGYWPIDPRAIDERLATERELDELVSLAHARGIRVLFDVVPNHVHEEHPWVKEHPSWLQEGCLCGQGACDWGEHIETCWFAPYLPDVDWTNLDAARAATLDVLWWFDRWDADGVRIDAVPMMPRSAVRRIAAAARRRYAHPGHALYILGENFTGPGGFQSLRYDLGPHGLDGSFHFPLMWTLREAIAREAEPMSAIDATFRAGEEAWRGSGAVMGLMIGNHDVARFASVSAGNADGDTWVSPPQPVDPVVYAKQRLALAAVLTLPGAPVLYYGDEVGLAGRNDPDCRRVMPAEEELYDAQRATRELTQRIGRARACSRALRRGARKTLVADAERFVFTREIDGEVVIVALARRPSRAREVSLPPGAPSALVDVVTGERVDASSGVLSLGAEAFDVRVLVAAGSACAR